MAVQHDDNSGSWDVPAALLAWLLPGLGHWRLGQRRRAAILAACIGGLWLAGLLIGGIGVINAKAHPAWFVGQALLAPTLGAHLVGQHLRAGELVGGQPPFRPSFGRVNEQGVLCTALAGLLNVLAVIDVLHRRDVESELGDQARPQGPEDPR